MSSKHFHPPARPDRRYLVLSLPRHLQIPRSVWRWVLVILLIGASNLTTHWLLSDRPKPEWASWHPLRELGREPLYLLDKLPAHLGDAQAFGHEVRRVARALDIPAEWLMAVMYAESRLDPAIVNQRGSQATGLIQFMPTTARELGTSVAALRQMTALEQLTYVQRYLADVRDRYGPYQSLTDLYLAILYPKARSQDYCYTLYAKPSMAYDRNRGLDEDRDGRVSVSDVDQFVRRLFPTAYALSLHSEE